MVWLAAKLAAGAAVFVLGNPAYYGRFGFCADHASGFESPYVGPHFIALALGRGEWPANSGKLRYAHAFAALGWFDPRARRNYAAIPGLILGKEGP
jgi:putative acetyltransferase